MTPKEIAATITAEDRKLILNSSRTIRRSKIEVIQDDAAQESKPKRTAVDRIWPQAGDVVIATNPWTGEQTEIAVISAPKRKHGVEFELKNGNRYHSPSPLCLYLFGKRVSNGWDCISWDNKEDTNA